MEWRILLSIELWCFLWWCRCVWMLNCIQFVPCAMCTAIWCYHIEKRAPYNNEKWSASYMYIQYLHPVFLFLRKMYLVLWVHLQTARTFQGRLNNTSNVFFIVIIFSRIWQFQANAKLKVRKTMNNGKCNTLSSDYEAKADRLLLLFIEIKCVEYINNECVP